ncbi:hypothetical protein B0H13DRAFT_1708728, partial [Mycena leptocephala]
MRAQSALPLADDVVDRILTFCPTFVALQSMVLVSKAFYNVFQTHSKSITRAVAYNIVGPALPQALRAIRYPLRNPDETLGAMDKDDPDTVATTCPEEHSASVITSEEKQRLEDNSEVVDTLEYIYSLTQKDRTSRKSVLAPAESWRFRRAVYRIWLYTNIFSGDRYSFDEINVGADGTHLIQRQRTALLNQYPTDELFQLYAVVHFFCGILKRVYAGHDDTQVNMLDILLSLGPGGIVRAWEERSTQSLYNDLSFGIFDVDDNPLYKGYFSLPLETIWTARKMKPPKDDEPATKWILDTINGANDTCSKCATPGGLTL